MMADRHDRARGQVASGFGRDGGTTRQHLLALAVWTIVFIALFFPLLTGAARLPDGDFTGQFYAFALFQSREIRAGRLPGWSPGSYGGVPFAADSQAAVFYPPRWLTILLTLPGEFTVYALQMEGLAHLWLAGALTYFLVFSMTGRPLAGLLSAVAFGLGGYLTSYPLLQLAVLETITWLPLALLLVRQAVQRKRPVPWLLGAGVVLGIGALAGHPQTFLHVAYVVAAYYLYLGWRARWGVRWLLGLGMVTLTVTLGTAAIWLLPALRALPYWTRSEVTYAFVSGGFGLLDYLQIAVPGVLSFWSPEYVGLVAGCLALYALLARRERERRSEVAFWTVLALVAAWLSLGDAGILFELVAKVAPGFSLFRHQERLAGIFSFSAAVLAGQGLALWLEGGDRWREEIGRLAWITPAGLLGAGLVLALVRPLSSETWAATWGRQWPFAAAAIGLLWGGRWRGLRAAGLILLLAVDLYGPVRKAMDLQAGSPEAAWSQPVWLDRQVAEEVGRVDSYGLFHINVGEAFGLEDVRGISPLKPVTAARFETLPQARRWQLLNVTHVWAWSPVDEALVEVDRIDESPVLGQEIEAAVYRFDDALPRAWMAYELILVPGEDEAFEKLRAPDLDPARQVILHGALPQWQEIRPPAEPATVQVARPEPDRLTIEAWTETPGVLVISEWRLPGWRAWLDGEPVSLVTADGALQGLFLPAGWHSIELRYVTPGVAAGAILTGTTLLLGIAAAVLWRPRINLRAQREPPAAAEREPLASRRIPAGAILILILVAFALRASTTATQELRGDEAFSYGVADRPAGDIIPYLAEIGETLAPFHYLALHGWLQLTGRSELALRYLSVCLGLLLLPLMVQVGRKAGGSRLGALLALLMVPSQLLIWVSQDVRSPYVWTPVLVVAATLMLVELASGTRRIPAFWLWVGYVLFGAAAVYSHYCGAFALMAHGLYLLFAPGGRRLLGTWAAAGTAVGLLVAPWVLTLWPRWMAAGHLSDPSTPELTEHIVTVGRALMTGRAYEAPAARWLFLGGLALAVTGARDLLRRGKPEWAGLMAGWLVSSTLVMYLFRFQRATFNDYYITTAAPAWFVLIGAGIVGLWQRRKALPRAGAMAGIGICMVAALLGLGHYYSNPAQQRTAGYREVAAYLAAGEQPGDLLVMNFPDPALVFYVEWLEMPRTTQPSSSDNSQEETEADLAELAASYARLWFVPAHNSVWDPEDIVFRWLDYHCLHEEALLRGRLELLAYRPVNTAASVMVPADLWLGDAFRLAGSYVTVDGLPAGSEGWLQTKPGASLEMTLLWEVAQVPAQDYTVYLHVLDENGLLIAQHDGVPLFGTRPTTTWLPGERLLDLHAFAIPEGAAATTAIVRVGLYLPATMERQILSNGDDGIPLVRVEVRP